MSRRGKKRAMQEEEEEDEYEVVDEEEDNDGVVVVIMLAALEAYSLRETGVAHESNCSQMARSHARPPYKSSRKCVPAMRPGLRPQMAASGKRLRYPITNASLHTSVLTCCRCLVVRMAALPSLLPSLSHQRTCVQRR